MSSLRYEELRATKEGYQRDVISRLLSQKGNEGGKTSPRRCRSGGFLFANFPLCAIGHGPNFVCDVDLRYGSRFDVLNLNL